MNTSTLALIVGLLIVSVTIHVMMIFILLKVIKQFWKQLFPEQTYQPYHGDSGPIGVMHHVSDDLFRYSPLFGGSIV